jgi:hypothetical protein
MRQSREKDQVPMRKIVWISIAAALFVPALPAQAAPAAGAVQATPAAQPPRDRSDTPDPNRQICVNERLSNSRMPRRVCHTAREWAQLQAGDSDD